MRVLRHKPAFTDARGSITDIFTGKSVNSLTIVTSAKGAVRGNHYHKKTTQYTYVLSGRFRLFVQDPGKAVETRIVKAGDLVVSPPLERHAFVALEKSRLLAFCAGPRAGNQYETDTFRLEQPISGAPPRRRSRARTAR